MTALRYLLPSACAFGIALVGCASAPPPTAILSSAQAAVRAAENANPSATGAQALREAQSKLAQARASADAGRNAEAYTFAEQAQISAELASAHARMTAARAEVDSRAARNADLRRKLLIESEK